MNSEVGEEATVEEVEERGAVPKLRFPEFRDTGEWQGKQLGDVAQFSSGGTPSKNVPEYWNGTIPWISASSMYDTNIYKSDLNITEFAVKNGAQIAEKGSLLILVRGSMLYNRVPMGIAAIDVAFNQDVKALSLDNKTNSVFLLYQLLAFESRISISQTGIGAGKIEMDDLKRLVIYNPIPSEQEKIAVCLSSLDNLITAQTQKRDALKTHKKGLMQQLFPAEGETVPELRFPEFSEAWRKSVLSSVIDLQSGYAFQSEYFSDQGGKLVTPKNFTKTGYADFNERNTKYTSEECDPKYICQEGDLLLLLTDLTPSCELLGKPLLLTKTDGNVLLNQRIVKIIPRGSINIGFLLHFFSTESFHKRIKSTATGSTVRHSSNKIILSTDIHLPSNQEQEKIAECLSSFDEQIAAQTQKLDALRTHKKGLMQQLFPVLDEGQE